MDAAGQARSRAGLTELSDDRDLLIGAIAALGAIKPSILRDVLNAMRNCLRPTSELVSVHDKRRNAEVSIDG